MYVDLVALHLNLKSGTYAMIPLSLIRDPNYWKEPLGRKRPFAQVLLDVCKKGEIKLLIDVHGMDKEENTVIIGGNYDRFQLYADILSEALQNQGIKNMSGERILAIPEVILRDL